VHVSEVASCVGAHCTMGRVLVGAACGAVGLGLMVAGQCWVAVLWLLTSLTAVALYPRTVVRVSPNGKAVFITGKLATSITIIVQLFIFSVTILCIISM